MEVVDVSNNQVEKVIEPSCQMPLEPIPEEPKPIAEAVPEEVVKDDVKPPGCTCR